MASNGIPFFFKLTFQIIHFNMTYCSYIKLSDGVAGFNTAPHSSRNCTKKKKKMTKGQNNG